MTALQRALAFRDGLMIALLARRPFRLKNFNSPAIGINVILDGDAVSFAFDASATKGKRPIDVPFPAHLLPALKIYLDHYRPILSSASGKATGVATHALWISRDGTALAGISLHKAIRRRTREAFGKPLPPHWFRDAAVTTLVRGAPAAARLTGSILVHTTPDLATKHYNQAQMIDSARRHADVIEALLDQNEPSDA
jgi:integrase/recombinase XerD